MRWWFGWLATASAIDGQANKLSDEDAERLWNDPNCERTRHEPLDWDLVRAHLQQVPFPESAPLVAQVVALAERDLDAAARVCPFGLISVLFFFVKHLLERDEPQLGAARAYFSLLDAFASGMHPHLLDSSDWLVKDRRITSLRRTLLKAVRDRGRRKRPFVYVYDFTDTLAQGATFCGKGQWGMEVHIHEWLLASAHLVADPADADLFFVPAYSICMFEGGFYSLEELDAQYVRLVEGLPHFGSGRAHVFTFGSGFSADVFRSWRTHIAQAVFLTPETWLFNDSPSAEPCFDSWKDVAIPGYLHRHEILSLEAGARPLADREHLAVFLGRTDPSRGPHPSGGGSDVRRAIRDLQPEVFVAQDLSMPEMHATMGNSRFCLVPKGKSAWSLRLYEALVANCVPVLLSDRWELPFEDFLDVTRFAVKWPMDRVGPELLQALAELPDEVVAAYMAAARHARCWYAYPPLLHELHLEGEPPCPEGQNAFVGIMWQLARKSTRGQPPFFQV